MKCTAEMIVISKTERVIYDYRGAVHSPREAVVEFVIELVQLDAKSGSSVEVVLSKEQWGSVRAGDRVTMALDGWVA